MKYVSGVGEYTMMFTVPENWSNYAGAFIDFEYGRDQIGSVIINGNELHANNASDRLDAGGLITEGPNTITVHLNSSLYERTYVEHSGYQDRGAGYGMGRGVLDFPDPEAYYNGLLSVRIIPYSEQ